MLLLLALLSWLWQPWVPLLAGVALLLSAATIVATWMGGGMILGGSGSAYDEGMLGVIVEVTVKLLPKPQRTAIVSRESCDSSSSRRAASTRMRST